MPADQHRLAHAKHNIDFLKTIYCTPDFHDWKVTAAFYSSVHLIEYLISVRGSVVFEGRTVSAQSSDDVRGQLDNRSTHQLRNQIVSGDSFFVSIHAQYNQLYKHCLTARYKQYSWSEQNAKLLIATTLKPIVNFV